MLNARGIHAVTFGLARQIAVYCDGSVARSTMESVIEASLANYYIGRIVVVIPDLDYGLVEQVVGPMNSGHVEEVAIRRDARHPEP